MRRTAYQLYLNEGSQASSDSYSDLQSELWIPNLNEVCQASLYRIQIQPVSYKRYFRCNNCFLLLVYTINLSLSTDLVDPPPMGTFYMKHALLWSSIKVKSFLFSLLRPSLRDLRSGLSLQMKYSLFWLILRCKLNASDSIIDFWKKKFSLNSPLKLNNVNPEVYL